MFHGALASRDLRRVCSTKDEPGPPQVRAMLNRMSRCLRAAAERATTEVYKHGPITAVTSLGLFATTFGTPAAFRAAGFGQPVETRIVLPDAPQWLLIFSIVVLAPVLEELVFRKWLIKAFRALSIPFWAAATISTALWVASHLPTNILAVLVYVITGLILCLLLHKTGRLWPCIVAHAAYNAPAAVILMVQ